MIPRGVCTAIGIIACPTHVSRGHAMIPRRVYTPLRINMCPLD